MEYITSLKRFQKHLGLIKKNSSPILSAIRKRLAKNIKKLDIFKNILILRSQIHSDIIKIMLHCARLTEVEIHKLIFEILEVLIPSMTSLSDEDAVQLMPLIAWGIAYRWNKDIQKTALKVRTVFITHYANQAGTKAWISHQLDDEIKRKEKARALVGENHVLVKKILSFLSPIALLNLPLGINKAIDSFRYDFLFNKKGEITCSHQRKYLVRILLVPSQQTKAILKAMPRSFLCAETQDALAKLAPLDQRFLAILNCFQVGIPTPKTYAELDPLLYSILEQRSLGLLEISISTIDEIKSFIAKLPEKELLQLIDPMLSAFATTDHNKNNLSFIVIQSCFLKLSLSQQKKFIAQLAQKFTFANKEIFNRILYNMIHLETFYPQEIFPQILNFIDSSFKTTQSDEPKWHYPSSLDAFIRKIIPYPYRSFAPLIIAMLLHKEDAIRSIAFKIIRILHSLIDRITIPKELIASIRTLLTVRDDAIRLLASNAMKTLYETLTDNFWLTYCLAIPKEAYQTLIHLHIETLALIPPLAADLRYLNRLFNMLSLPEANEELSHQIIEKSTSSDLVIQQEVPQLIRTLLHIGALKTPIDFAIASLFNSSLFCKPEIKFLCLMIKTLPKETCQEIIALPIKKLCSTKTSTKAVHQIILALAQKNYEHTYHESAAQSLSDRQKEAFMALDRYGQERERNLKEYTGFARFFGSANAHSRMAKLKSVTLLKDQILRGGFNQKKLPDAAKNGKLGALVKTFRF